MKHSLLGTSWANVCVCVCLYCVCNIKPMLLISGRKCQASIEFSGRSSYYEALKRGEKCLRLLVMPPHSSCSHRWSASYYQQEVSWHLPIFSATIMLHNLSFSFLFLSLSSFQKYPFILHYLTTCSLAKTFWSQVSRSQVYFLFYFFQFGLTKKLANHTALKHRRDSPGPCFLPPPHSPPPFFHFSTFWKANKVNWIIFSALSLL